MGQNNSGFVVEIASPRLGRFQALPQKEPSDDSSSICQSSEWRITVNPAAEMFGSERLKSLVDRLYHQQKLFTLSDAKQVLSALQGIDPSADLLLPLLTVVSNATAYPANQILMRESSITSRITSMLCSRLQWSRPCRVMLLQCVANMAVCADNQNIVKCSIPHVVQRLNNSTDEMEIVVALQALTNLSLHITTDQISLFTPAIPVCLQRLWVKGEVNLNALRLLVNLSCCPDIVPYILGSKSVIGLLRILDTDKEEVLLRAITWLLCTSSAVDALSLSYDKIAPLNQDPFRNPAHTLYHSIFGPKAREELEGRCNELLTHKNKEIASKTGRLLDILIGIPPFPTPAMHLNRL